MVNGTQIFFGGAESEGKRARETELGYSEPMEIVFEVRDAEEGGYTARALGHGIFTQGDTWDDLRSHVLEATALHFEDEGEQPRLVQLHYVKDELIPVAAA